MKTNSDQFQIGRGARDEHDQKLEPEEQPVRRILTSDAKMDAGDLGDAIEAQQGRSLSVPLSVTAEMIALDAIEMLARQCHLCVHWRRDEFQREKKILEATAVGRRDLDVMRAQAIDCGADVPENVDLSEADPVLAIMGKCMALSDLARDSIYSHPQACCPANGPGGEPLPLLFKPRSERDEMAVRDRILNAAQGRS